MYKYKFSNFTPYTDGNVSKVSIFINAYWDDVLLAKKRFVVGLDQLINIVGNPPNLGKLKDLIVDNVVTNKAIGIAELEKLKQVYDAKEQAKGTAQAFCDILSNKLGDIGYGVEIEMSITEVGGKYTAQSKVTVNPEPEAIP